MRKLRGGLLLAFGIVFFALSVSFLFYAKSIAILEEGHASLPWQIVGLIGFPISFALLRRGGRYFVMGADAAMTTDPRPPVLYLRSFKDDDSTVDLPKPLLTPDFFVFSPNPRAEEMLAGLNTIGPLVAIGKPGEDLPEAGAFRLYVPDTEWKAKVHEIMERCRIVVMLGKTTTGGVHWEIGEAIAKLRPDQLLFFFPHAVNDEEIMEKNYYAFRNSVQRYFPSELPEVIGHSNFLRFTDGWRAEWVGDKNDKSKGKFQSDMSVIAKFYLEEGECNLKVCFWKAIAAAPLHRKIIGMCMVIVPMAFFLVLIAWLYNDIVSMP